ncbi:hypothetical protein, partial [Burkholderia ubonensis]|uniref:hypothetical protein n=1 Tax=Burkholderia ubonensis TaxID=101571 RepID=UPI001E583D26
MVSINECDARRAHRRVNEPGRAATRAARPNLQPPRVCLHMERACVATRTAAREARDAANTGRIRKERNAASGRSRGNPKL